MSVRSLGASRLLTRLVVVLTALLVGAAVLAAPAQADIKVTPRFFGVHDKTLAPDTPAGFPKAQVGAVRLWDSGVSWRSIERRDGRFRWAALDQQVADARANRARPMVILGSTPRFHALRPNVDGFYGRGSASPPKLRKFKRWVRKVATRYGTRVDYQVWNEPNVIGFWTGTPQQAARLTKATYTIVHRIAPGAKVVGPSFPLRLQGQRTWFQGFWSQRVDGVPVGRYVDVASFAGYPAGDQGPEEGLEIIAFARQTLRSNGVRAPMWNSEVNYGLSSDGSSQPISKSRQASFVMRTFLLNASVDVRRVYWYRWENLASANVHLLRADGVRLTRAGKAFRRIITWMNGATMRACKRDGAGVWSCRMTTPTETRTFYWRRSGESRIAAPAKAFQIERQGGSTAAIAPGASVRIGSSVTLIRASR